MTRYLTTLLVLATCVALAMPAWADVPSFCGNELRNPGFETGDFSHWTLTTDGDGTDSVVGAYAHTGSYGVWGDPGETISQVFDETLIWDGDVSSPNPGWLDDGIWKEFDVIAWARLEDSQSITIQMHWWDNVYNAGAAPTLGSYTDSASPSTYTVSGIDAGAGTYNDHNFYYQKEIEDEQPRWMQIDITFGGTQTVGGPFLDDITVEGTCKTEFDDDSPEAATWLLLACTGVFGTWARRRRKT